jgi:TonB family protein
MLGRSHSARKKALGVTERRARTRTPVTPPIYADLGKVNGGLIYNMTADGLALSAAMILGEVDLLSMRILLPDSGGWMKATGQITWKSESRKTAGIRFVTLPEEARQRITDWLAAENSQGEPQAGAEIVPKPQQQHPAGGALAGTPVFLLPDPVESSTVAEERIPELYLPGDSSALINQPAGIVAELFPQSTWAGSDNLVGGDSSAQPGERRVHPRQQIRPIRYIDLGDNGGLLHNISEGGLAVITTMTLAEKNLPSIRIEFKGPREQIEVSGQIAWINESRREAGIRFVNPTESARQIIARRISQQELPSELQAQNVTVPDSLAIHPEIPEIPKLKFLAPVDPPSGRVVQQHWQSSAPPPLAVPWMHAEKETPTFAASDTWPPKTSEKNESKRKPTPVIHPLSSEGGAESRRKLAVTVILSGLAAVAIGWVATRPAARKELVASIGQNTEGLNKHAEVNMPIPATKTTDAPALRSENSGPQAQAFDLPANRPRNGSADHLETVPLQAGNIDLRAARPTVNSDVRRAENSLPESQPAKLPERAVVAVPNPVVENTRSQVVESSPAQPTESAATPATSPAAENVRSPVAESSPAKPTESTATAAMSPAARVPSITVSEVKESPPPPSKPPTASVAPTWSVAVSTDPYPSIRVPADISSQKPSSGRSLQIGRAISLVEPVYPEDAKSQGIEGTVKLHVVVGGDGSVQNVELKSGPALLAKAASSAIREWRYARTLLGGQPVETEQDVIIKFRMAGPSNPKN